MFLHQVYLTNRPSDKYRSAFAYLSAAVFILLFSSLFFSSPREAFADGVFQGCESSGGGDSAGAACVLSGTWVSESGRTVTVGAANTVVVQGHLSTNGPLVNYGRILIEGDGEIDNNSVIHNRGVIEIRGWLENTGTRVNNYDDSKIIILDGGYFQNTSPTIFNVNGGTLNNNGEVQVQHGGTFQNSNGLLHNKPFVFVPATDAGRLENSGVFNNYHGKITNEGTIDNKPGGEIVNEQEGAITNSGSMYNSGLITNSAGSRFLTDYSGGVIKNCGVLINHAGKLIDSNGGEIINDGSDCNKGSSDPVGSITNLGVITASVVSIPLKDEWNGHIRNNAGGVILNVGEIDIDGEKSFLHNGGTVYSDCGSVLFNNDIQGALPKDICSTPPVPDVSFTTREDTVAIVPKAKDLDGHLVGVRLSEVPNIATRYFVNLFTPPADFAGTIELPVTALFYGTERTITLTATVTPVNDPPVAIPLAVTASTGQPTDFAITGSDIEHEPLTFSIVSQPASGTLSGTAPNLTYTPNADFSGSDSFTFRVNDGTSNSAAATVSITVNPVAEEDDEIRSGDINMRVATVNQQPPVTAFTESYFVENPLARVQVSSFAFLDAGGASINQAGVGQQISISGAFTNYQEEEQGYASIVQITGEDGSVAHVSWQQGTVESGQTADVSTSWTPVADGIHTVQIFVWNDVGTAPTPLSTVTINNIDVKE